jgi:3',5'-cyclic-AMP phosphodiesterase
MEKIDKNKNGERKMSIVALAFLIVAIAALHLTQFLSSKKEPVFNQEVLGMEIFDETQLELTGESQEIDPGDEQYSEGETELEPDEIPPIGLTSPASPLQKKNDSGGIRIGFATDFHVASNGGTLMGVYSKKISHFVEQMNNVYRPDFIVLGGDIIEGTGVNAEMGKKELGSVARLLNRTSIRKYWVVGNHDLRSVTKPQWKSALGIDYLSKSFDVGEYRIIILDSNFTKDEKDVSPGNPYTRGKVSRKQVQWLTNELKKTNKKVLVFMHHPPLRGISARTDINLLHDAPDLQAIFSKYGVLAVFSGHIETVFRKEIGGVTYVVLPGMTKHPNYQGAFAEISLNGKKLDISLSYQKDGGGYQKIKVGKK